MNVTLKLPDDVCREAKHRAEDQSMSLSQWMASLVFKELGKSEKNNGSAHRWMDAFSGNNAFLERDFPLTDRKSMKAREFNFKA